MIRFSFGAVLGAALLALAASPLQAQTQDDFFDDTYVHEMRLAVKASDWDLLRKNYDDNTYYPADVHWIFKGKDITIQDAGIRSRGHGSRSPIKPNLRVDLNRYEPGQRFLDMASFILKANNQDPSMLREPVIFKLWSKMGLPASREAYTRLYINNVYWGSYVIEEEIRSPEYTSRYLNDTGGDLYEWKPLSTLEGWSDGYHFEWASSCKAGQVACSSDQAKWNPMPWNPEENKSTFDLAPTINIHRMASQASDADFDKTMSAMFDLKLFLVHNAIEVWASDFDSFLGDAYGINNIWIYRYKGTNFHQFLLWDKDGAFNLWDKNSPYLGADRPLFRNAGADGDSSPTTNVLMRRTLTSAARKTEYLEAVYKTAVLAGGAGGWLDWEHQRDYAMAGDSIREDPNKQWSDQGVEKASNNELWESESRLEPDIHPVPLQIRDGRLEAAGAAIPCFDLHHGERSGQCRHQPCRCGGAWIGSQHLWLGIQHGCRGGSQPYPLAEDAGRPDGLREWIRGADTVRVAGSDQCADSLGSRCGRGNHAVHSRRQWSDDQRHSRQFTGQRDLHEYSFQFDRPIFTRCLRGCRYRRRARKTREGRRHSGGIRQWVGTGQQPAAQRRGFSFGQAGGMPAAPDCDDWRGPG